MSLVSVVIPAYGHCSHLDDLLRALHQQTLPPDEIVVSHTGPSDPSAAIARAFPRVHVLHQDSRLFGGAARNRGAMVAQGEWIAFVDADVRPRPDWIERLLEAGRAAPNRFVVGSVGYCTTGGYWGVSNWLSEFSEQAPWHAPREQAGGASCNMVVRKADFEAAGCFPEAYQPGEDTALFAELRRLGRQQWFSPESRVDHHNVRGLRRFFSHQLRLGRHSALVRQRLALRGSLATQLGPLSFFLWVPRMALFTGRLAKGGPVWWVRGSLHAPALVVGSWVWGLGFVDQVVRRTLRHEEPAAEGPTCGGDACP
jgi:GT2 family glycosyltransferase